MDLLFKVTAADPSTPPLVGETNFPEHYSGVNISMAWSELQPAIRQATQKFVLPYIGPEFYDPLASLYQASADLADLSDLQKQVLEYLQDCIAFYTIYHILPEKNSVIASMGVIQNTPSEGSGAPVSQWSWKAKRWSALENADAFLDLLLTFMEQQVNLGESYFETWKQSAAYQVKTSSFFRLTSELDEYLNIQASRRSFISLVKYMRDVEEDVIRPLLCYNQFEVLKGNDLSADEKELLARVRKTVAYLGLVDAIPHHRIVIDGEGFRVVSSTDQFDDRRNLTNNTHEGAIADLAQKAAEKGRRYLEDLHIFLLANEGKYPLWANSICNAKSTIKGHSIRVSPDGKGGIGIF